MTDKQKIEFIISIICELYGYEHTDISKDRAVAIIDIIDYVAKKGEDDDQH